MILTTTFYYAVTLSYFIKDIRFFVTEICKSIPQTNPKFMWSFFKKKKLPYILRKGPILNLPRTQSTYYSTNAVHIRGSLVWNNLPTKVKPLIPFSILKLKLKI